MTQNYTMMLTRYLISGLLLVIYLQSIEAKNAYRPMEKQICGSYALAKSENDLRGVKDVWAKIRESAIKSWNYIKSVAEQTRDKLKIFVENVKEQAKDLKNSFEEKLGELKEKLNKIISDIYGTGELVKLCIKKEQENVEDILKEIMSKMGQCIAEEINNLTVFEREDLQMNETAFIKQFDDKIELCNRDMENFQICLCEVREDIFDNLTSVENDILKKHYDSRNIADDIKATLVTCSLNNLIDATNLVTMEVLEIAKCVLEEKENRVEAEPEPSD